MPIPETIEASVKRILPEPALTVTRKRLNIVSDQVLDITQLGERIDFLANALSESEDIATRNSNILKSLASNLNVEVCVTDIDGYLQRTLQRPVEQRTIEEKTYLKYCLTYEEILKTSNEVKEIRGYFHNQIPHLIDQLNPDKTSPSVIITGSMAYKILILHLWNSPESPIFDQLCREYKHDESAKIAFTTLIDCITPRDVDIIITDPKQHYETIEKIEAFIDQIKIIHPDHTIHEDKIIPGQEQRIDFKSGKGKTNRIALVGAAPFPNCIHCTVDITSRILTDHTESAPEAARYTVVPYDNNSVPIRSIDSIIMDELACLQRKYGGGEERIKKAIIRLFVLAELESRKPALNPASRITLLHALCSIEGIHQNIDNTIEKLRQQPLYIICHEDHLLGATLYPLHSSAQPAPSCQTSSDAVSVKYAG